MLLQVQAELWAKDRFLVLNVLGTGKSKVGKVPKPLGLDICKYFDNDLPLFYDLKALEESPWFLFDGDY